MIFNYIKLFLWTSIYYFQKSKSEIIEDIIIKNIKDCGCITIKFSQWILPKIESIYNIDLTNENFSWFKKLETLYDDCNEHNFEYTNDLYSKEFNSDIKKDYDIIRLIASGSIGQVYKIKSKIDGKYYALKCLHPNLEKHILFFRILIWLLYNIPIIRIYVRYYLPINLMDFIKDFRTQTNLLNEGNNCLKFTDYYKIIIPKVSRMSHSILIMSYEDGIKYTDNTISTYNRSKVFLLMKLFIKNNEHILNFIHGDLHKGNWRVRIDDNNDVKLIIYDFGFCWYVPNFLIDHLENIDQTFLKVSDENPSDKVRNDFAYYSHILVNNACSKEDIVEAIDFLKDKGFKYDDPSFLFQLILITMRKNNRLIDSYVIQSLIVHNQLGKEIKKYDHTLSMDNNNSGQIREFYQKRILDIKNYCNTYNIFPEYIILLDREYELNKDEFNDNELSNIEGYDYELLKSLALS